MSRHPIAATVLALERARDRIEREYRVPVELVDRASKGIARQVGEALVLDQRDFEVVREIAVLGDRMRRAVVHAAVAAKAALKEEIVSARNMLWLLRSPQSAPEVTGTSGRRGGGHLRDLPESGEPQLMPGWRYEPTPLVMPASVELGIATQGKPSNCYFVAVVNAVARSDSDALRRMVRRDPDDENVVIVDVSAGTYRLPATLPVEETTGERTGATSPDGSTLVAYLEKAAAAHFGSWADIVSGIPIYPLAWLAGGSHKAFNVFHVTELTDEDIRDVVASSGPAAVSLGRAAGDVPAALDVLSRSKLAARHGYTVAGATSDGDIRLHNPWGELHPEPVSIQDLRGLNVSVTWAGDHVPMNPPRARGGLAVTNARHRRSVRSTLQERAADTLGP